MALSATPQSARAGGAFPTRARHPRTKSPLTSLTGWITRLTRNGSAGKSKGHADAAANPNPNTDAGTPPTSPILSDAPPRPGVGGGSGVDTARRSVYLLSLSGKVERVERIDRPDGSYVDVPPARPRRRSSLRGSPDGGGGDGGDPHPQRGQTWLASPSDPAARRSIEFSATAPVEHAALAHDVYDRRGPKPWKTRTTYQKLRIKKELNRFKRNEMPVHAESVKFTRFHR